MQKKRIRNNVAGKLNYGCTCTASVVHEPPDSDHVALRVQAHARGDAQTRQLLTAGQTRVVLLVQAVQHCKQTRFSEKRKTVKPFRRKTDQKQPLITLMFSPC